MTAPAIDTSTRLHAIPVEPHNPAGCTNCEFLDGILREAATLELDAITDALWRAMKELGWRVKGGDGMTDLPPNFVASELVSRLTERRTGR